MEVSSNKTIMTLRQSQIVPILPFELCAHMHFITSIDSLKMTSNSRTNTRWRIANILIHHELFSEMISPRILNKTGLGPAKRFQVNLILQKYTHFPKCSACTTLHNTEMELVIIVMEAPSSDIDSLDFPQDQYPLVKFVVG